MDGYNYTFYSPCNMEIKCYGLKPDTIAELAVQPIKMGVSFRKLLKKYFINVSIC